MGPGTNTYGNSKYHPISDAKKGVLPEKPDGTYVVLGDPKHSNDAIVMQGKTQIPYRPDYSVQGDTIDIIDRIRTPNGKWGAADHKEPLTKDFKEFGPGKVHQGLVEGELPVNPSTLRTLD